MKQLHTGGGSALRAELSALAGERDPELWAEGLLRLADRLASRGRREEALRLWACLTDSTESWPEAAQAALRKAERRRAAFLGRGAIGDRVEVLLRGFAQDSSDPAMLASFLVGGTVYRAVRAGLLSKLAAGAAGPLSRGSVAPFFASSGAFLAELPAFVMTSRWVRALGASSPEIHPRGVGEDCLAAGIFLFFLKSSAALGRNLAQGFDAVSGWNAASALSQAGLFAGILAGHRAEAALGFRDPESGAAEWVHALATFAQLKVGGRLSESLLGPGPRLVLGELEARSRFASAVGRRVSGWVPGFGRPAAAEPFPGFRMGSDEGRSKVVPIFPGLQAPASREAVKPPHPQDLLGRREALALRADALLVQTNKAIGALFSGVEIYAQYLERGVNPTPLRETLQKRLAEEKESFSARAREAQDLLHEWNALSFGLPSVSSAPFGLGHWRDALREFTSSIKQFEMALETMEKRLGAGRALELIEALNESSRHLPYYFQYEPVSGLNWNADPAILTKASRVLGMAYGLLGPDLLRGSAQESEALRLTERILKNLQNSEDRGHLRALLIRIYPQGGIGYQIPREGLAEGGTHFAPFRSWLGVHLPALTIFHRGQVEAVRRNLRGIEFFMEPRLLEASRETLDWLKFLLEKPGDPRDWAAQANPRSAAARALKVAEAPDSGAEEWRRSLGEQDPRAVLHHALHAFLRGSYDPAAAWKIASASSPPKLRGEVLALTGAFSGAFQGRGAFHRGLLIPAMQEAFPELDWNDWIYGKWENGLFRLFLSHSARPWDVSPEASSWPRLLNPVGKAASLHPRWIAFKEGFLERQLEIEIHLFDLVRRAGRGLAEGPKRVPASELRGLHSELDAELRQLALGFKDLRRYVHQGAPKLESSPLPEPLLRPLLDDLKWRTDRIEGGIKAFRRFMVGLRREAAKPLFWPRNWQWQRFRGQLSEVADAFPAKERENIETQLIHTLMESLRREFEAADFPPYP